MSALNGCVICQRLAVLWVVSNTGEELPMCAEHGLDAQAEQ